MNVHYRERHKSRPWQAQPRVNGQKRHFGYFDTLGEAETVVRAVRRLHPNKPNRAGGVLGVSLEKREQIYQAYRGGRSSYAVASMFGVSPSFVQKLARLSDRGKGVQTCPTTLR